MGSWTQRQAGPLKVALLCLVVLASYGLYLGIYARLAPAQAVAAPAGSPTLTAVAPSPTPPANATTSAASIAAAAVSPVAPSPTVAPTAAPTLTPTPPATSTATPTSTATATVTPAPTFTATPAPAPSPVSPTPAPAPAAGAATVGPLQPALNIRQEAGSGLRVGLRRADGTPIGGIYVQVYNQISDVSGNPAFGDPVSDGNTDNTGLISFKEAPGTYALKINGLNGYTWGSPYNVKVAADHATVVGVTLGRLTVGLEDADGKPLNQYVQVFRQQADVSGAPAFADAAADGYTQNTGVIRFDLTPGVYALRISGLPGYPWGNQFNYGVSAGKTAQLTIVLGRIVVGVSDVSQKPASRYVRVFSLQKDVNGKPAPKDQVSDGYTSGQTGLASFDLTAGDYAVAVDGFDPQLVSVASGKTQTVRLTGAK